MQIFTHGSEDSLDHDVYVIFDHIPTFHEAKSHCDSLDDMNANILVLKDGVVDWCFKGTEDECNNSLFSTYSLHEQAYPNPIIHKVERDIPLKLVRTIRGLLSYFSRTSIRIKIKAALRSSSYEEKMSALKVCQLSYDIDFKKATHIEVFKFYAFQLGQTLALIEHNVELFTKKDVASYYPELYPYLYREVACTEELQAFFERFISWCDSHITQEGVDSYKLTSFYFKSDSFSFKEISKF